MTHPVRGAIFWWLEARAKSAVKKWCERHKKHHMVHTDYRQHHTNRKHQSSAQRFAAHLNAQKHVPSLKIGLLIPATPPQKRFAKTSVQTRKSPLSAFLADGHEGIILLMRHPPTHTIKLRAGCVAKLSRLCSGSLQRRRKESFCSRE